MRRLWSGVGYSMRLGINFPRFLTIPRNLCSSLTEIGKGILVIASVFEGSILIPSDKIMCPKNTIDCFLIWNLVLFSFKPLSLIFKKTFLRHWSCSWKVFPHYYEVVLGIHTAWYVRNNWSNFPLKTSLAEWIP